MDFKRKYFRKFPEFLFKEYDKKCWFGKPLADLSDEVLLKISGRTVWSNGESFLPKIIGKYSKENANGKEIVRKDLPKEQTSTMFYYTRKEWHGDKQVEVKDFAYRYYQRYPRETKPAQNIFVTCIGDNLVIEVDLINDVESLNLHKINLALELFGSQFDIFKLDEEGVLTIPKKPFFVRWEILPAGQYNKQDLLKKMRDSIPDRTKKSLKAVIEKRLESITKFSHDEIFVGLAGYQGYIVFIFKNKDIALLECDKPYNATYIFDYEKWDVLSQKSKTEILDNNLAKDRIIHNESWLEKIKKLLG